MSDNVKIKPYFKGELARLYNVSVPTIGRWIKKHQSDLEKLGYEESDRILTIPMIELLFERLGHPS